MMAAAAEEQSSCGDSREKDSHRKRRNLRWMIIRYRYRIKRQLRYM